MRVAPVGLACADPFTVGCMTAALTHGHPSGYLAAGAFAVIIQRLAQGRELADAITIATDVLSHIPGPADASEVIGSLAEATQAAGDGPANSEKIAALGGGWVAEEALAIAVYCALTATDFRSGVLAAVNHGGDSDNTGAICGNLLGVSLGIDAIDTDLLHGLEGHDVITRVADDLHAVSAGGQTPAGARYPPG